MEKWSENLFPVYLLVFVRCAAENHTTCTKILGCKLGLSENTIKTYWKRAKALLGVEERHQVIERVKENGWLEISFVTGGG